MGWQALYKDGTLIQEGNDARPVADGNKGKLSFIMQEDYGHKIAIDLNAGVIILDYEYADIQGGNPAFANYHALINICKDTLIVGELFGLKRTSEPDAEGWYTQEAVPIKWRPIWFSRVINGEATKIIGAQATLPKEYGRTNVKKMVMLFPDGRLGIY